MLFLLYFCFVSLHLLSALPKPLSKVLGLGKDQDFASSSTPF